MFHVFPLVCFLIYGVKRRQTLIAKPHFYIYFFRFYTFYILINNFMFFHQNTTKGCATKPDCSLRQGAGGTEFARNGSRTCFLR